MHQPNLNQTKNVDTTKTITHISLCAGYGGIDIGLKRAIPNLRTIAFSEIEAFACANLVAKMEAGFLDAAPIWTDLKTFPWAEFRGKVDILSGGYPCQPFSAAGKRLGKEDPRHLWPWIADGIRDMRPAVCFFENVEGHISLGLSTVVSDLEELGYKVSWGIFSASEVGAPHQRKRVFIMAHSLCQGSQGLARFMDVRRSNQKPRGSACEESVREFDGWQLVSYASDCLNNDDGDGDCSICGDPYVDCLCPGPTQDGYEYEWFGDDLYARPEQLWPSRPGEQQHEWEPPRVVGNTKSERSATRMAKHEGFSGEICPVCPSGEGAMGNPGVQESCRLSDRAGRNQMAEARKPSDCGTEPDGGEGATREIEFKVGRDTDGTPRGLGYAELYTSCDNRTDELRLLGNGVVPATAEKAFQVLSKELSNP